MGGGEILRMILQDSKKYIQDSVQVNKDRPQTAQAGMPPRPDTAQMQRPTTR